MLIIHLFHNYPLLPPYPSFVAHPLPSPPPSLLPPNFLPYPPAPSKYIYIYSKTKFDISEFVFECSFLDFSLDTDAFAFTSHDEYYLFYPSHDLNHLYSIMFLF